MTLLLLFFMLVYLAPLPPMGGCPHHGPSCAHGGSCPAVQRRLAEKAVATCHTGADGGHEARAKKYRCFISSCHGEDEPGLSGLETPFIVDLARSSSDISFTALAQQDSSLDEDLSVEDISRPPEGRLLC